MSDRGLEEVPNPSALFLADRSQTDPETGDEEGLPAAIQEAMANALAVVKRHFPVIIAVGGLVMVALGLLILTGEFTILNNKAQELTSELGLPSTSV